MALSVECCGDWDFRAHPTRAIPKHTLMGSTLQLYDQQDRENLKKIDTNALQRQEEFERKQFISRYNHKVPDEWQKYIDGMDDLDRHKQELADQQKRVASSKRRFKLIEEETLYQQVATHPHCTNNKSQDSNQRSRICLPMALPGDKLPAASIPRPNQPSVYRCMDYPYHRNKGPQWMPSEAYMNENHDKSLVQLPRSLASQFGCELPANIQHQFRSDNCHNLFQNDASVETAAQKLSGPSSHVHRPSHQSKSIQDSTARESLYNSLSHVLRHAVGHGVSVRYNRGVTQTDFTDRAQNIRPLPDHRVCKDDLSKWAEHNIIRSRMNKAWEERYTSTKEGK